MLVGVFAKESVLFIAPLYYTFEARRRWDAGAIAWTLLLALPAVAALTFLRATIPEWNGHAGYLASLPRAVQLDVRNVPAYDIFTTFRFTVAERVHEWWMTLSHVLLSFGSLGVVLIAPGWRRLRPVLSRFWPFLALVGSQLLFAMNTQRLVVFAFVPVVIASIYGAQEAKDRFQLWEGWCMMAVIAAVGLELSSSTASSPPPLLQAEVLGAIAVLATMQARLTNRHAKTCDGSLVGSRTSG